MTEPAWKAKNIREALDDMTNFLYGRSVSDSIRADTCISCKQPAVEFTDEISRREFAISGLCQKCQDIVFAPDEEE